MAELYFSKVLRTLIKEGNGKNLEFEKLSHFLNLLDFQLLSKQVSYRVVENFRNKSVNNSVKTLAMVGVYTSIRW